MRRLVVAAVVGLVALGACSTATDRPAGIAERFLQAVSDSGRDNLFADSTDRAGDYGDTALLDELVPDDGVRAADTRVFRDLEVGRATVDGDHARVPVRATVNLADDETAVLETTLVLRADGDGWWVESTSPRAVTERVPSEGGSRPAGASTGQWVVAIAITVALTLVFVALVGLQPDPARFRR